MADRVGGRPPYVTAILIIRGAEQSHTRAYVRGKLSLAGIDESRVSFARWIDAVYVILLEAPDDELRKAHDHLILQTAKARPDRATWGATPEQQEMMQRVQGGSRAGQAPPARDRRRDGRGRTIG